MLLTPWYAVFVSLPVAAFGSSYATRIVAAVMQRCMPTTETYTRRQAELVGCAGEAMFEITERFGLAVVKDSRGDRFQVACRVYADRPTIAKGTRVLLVDFSPASRVFYVIRNDVDVNDAGTDRS
jgi:hypothetical protein